MKSIIKSRFLKRFRTVSNNKEEDSKFGLDVGKKHVDNNIDMLLYESSLLPKDIDVFQECDSEFDDSSIPNMITSSSSSSSSSYSSCSSPKSIEENRDEDQTKSSSQNMVFENKVVLYTTSLRGIRKTYEDCRAIKFLLESFRVVYLEKDVSMDLEYRDELWRVLGKRSVPPRLFIKGRHVGGADEVVTMHECGMLKVLLEGVPKLGLGESVKCRQCGGVGFLVCLDCHGNCKIYKRGEKNEGSLFGRCAKCNENGLIRCPSCSY